jgi:hypothetical protein
MPKIKVPKHKPAGSGKRAAPHRGTKTESPVDQSVAMKERDRANKRRGA